MGKVIVDSSVWIDFFKGNLKEVILTNLVAGLEDDQIAITDVIAHELIVGTKTKKHYEEMIDILSPLTQLRIQAEQLEKFNHFSWQVHKEGLSGKYTDLTIAYLSQIHQYPILSFDKYFHKLAKKGFIEVIEY